MLPITPTSDTVSDTDWITNNQRRRIVTPGDNENNQDSNSNSNSNGNRLSSLEDDDTDSDDDVSLSSTPSVLDDVSISSTPSVLAIETDAAYAIAYHLDIAEAYLNATFEASATDEFNCLYQDQDPDPDTASTASSSTVSSCGSSIGQDIMTSMPSIDEYLPKEYQTATKSNFNFADAVVFREALGNALAACQHADRDAGHSYLVDTPKRYGERYGDLSIILPPPAEKTPLPPEDALGGTWKRFYELKKMYVREDHWNKEALNATVRRFPSAMKEEKDDYGAMPLKYSVRQALNFIESKVSDRVKKQKAYIDLMSNITAQAYVPSTDGPVVYLKAVEHDKHCIDILSGSSTATFEYSWETLIINCQTKIRASGKHNNTYLRMIEDKWETDVTSGGRWERFKSLYIKELQQLTDDDIGVDNTAMKAQQALIARVDAFESKYESDVQTLNDNQLHLETAFQASAVPSVVETTGTGTVSGSIASTAASGVVSPTVLLEIIYDWFPQFL